MSGDWIHTRRGVRLVEGTLPRLAAALEGLTERLDRLEQPELREADVLRFLETTDVHTLGRLAAIINGRLWGDVLNGKEE